ncbi:MAG TPA: prepilin peptidase [Acidobacteriaceae bacterium]|nr:prepilin peptidase [Acidobacteriaceae bacterium]
MPTGLIVALIALLGLAFGSFLNVCIARLPRHESIVRPRSRCPRCGVTIGARDNIPLLNWILLRGKCRACAWRIPWRYPAVEAAMAALWVLCYLRFGLTIFSAGMAVLCFLLLGLAVMDAETMRLPDALTWPGIAAGVVWSGLEIGAEGKLSDALLLWPGSTSRIALHGGFIVTSKYPPLLVGMVASALWALVGALLILAIRWLYRLLRHREGMGIGDAKLLAMIAAWLGPMITLLTLFLGVVGAALVGVLWTVIRGRRGAMTMRLPFGAFLCAAALYAIFAGAPILAWYLKFFS